ncbi:hypothetical protein C3R19_09150, partial [Blautia producta]
GPAAPAGLPLWPESVVREEKRERRLEEKERTSFGRKRESVIREKKVEIGRGGGHRIGNKGEFWWDYAGL